MSPTVGLLMSVCYMKPAQKFKAVSSDVRKGKGGRRSRMKNSGGVSGEVPREIGGLRIVATATLTGEEEVSEEHGVGPGSSEISTATALLETNIDASEDGDEVQYEYNDGMTYRVVQVDEGSGSGATGSSVTNFSSSSPTPVQALYTSPINGGIYVLGPSTEVFPLNTGQKATFARGHDDGSRPSVTVVKRDDKRRQTHNEVERRRRDKINNWIVKLSKIIPEIKNETTKGNFESQSKGGILAKACDYINELRENNQRLLVYVKENERLVSDIEQLGRQMEELKIENEQLRSVLQQHGLPIP